MTVVDQRAAPPPNQATDIDADLGFGSVVARESRERLLNRDGSFNVRRTGLRFWESLSAYHYFLTISWPKFLAFVGAGYVLTNALFAAIYVLLGADALAGAEHLDVLHRCIKAFFFSVHTLATIGYGNIYPVSLGADVVVAIEALVGLLGFAAGAGLVFARFSRPTACIVFSRNAIVAPYRGGRTAFMFRIVNKRSNQLVELQAKVLLSRRKKDGGAADREFIALNLERDRVVFFPLAWTIVHPIDEKSPLYGWSPDDLAASESEFLILLNGFDETFSQTVHTRSSYRFHEVVWGARFANIFNPPDEDGVISVDIRKVHDVEPAL